MESWTVKRLIEELSKWPEDMIVVTSSSSGEIRSIDEVYPQHILDQKMLVVD